MSSVPDGFKEDYGPPVTARVPVFIKKVPVAIQNCRLFKRSI